MEKNEERFDAVGTMRRIRDRLSRETEGMSYEEQKRRLSDVSRTGQGRLSEDARAAVEQDTR